MIFKNLSIYRVGGQVDPAVLEAHLNKRAFKSCPPGGEKSTGFSRIFGSEGRLFSHAGLHLFCLKSEERKIPPAVVKTKLKKVIEKEQRAIGRLVNREERKEFIAQVRADLMKSAEDFVQSQDTWAYFDNTAQMLVINTTSPKTAANLADFLRDGVQCLVLHPLKPNRDISDQITGWLRERSLPGSFVAGVKCDLTNDLGTLKYNKLDLDDPRLIGYLAEGMRLTCLALAYGERCTFTLEEDFTIKSLVFSERVLMDLDHGSGEPLEELAGDLTLMASEVRDLVEKLFQVIDSE